MVHYEPNCSLKGDFTMVRYEPYYFSTLAYKGKGDVYSEPYCSRPWRIKVYCRVPGR